jgi:hypothetical protein
MSQSFYLGLSWTLSMAWKAFSVIVPADTKAKIHVSSENTMKEITDLFHPCQLEKRFGGSAETPKNFWPPYVGKYFIPDSSPNCQNIMTDSVYI